MKKNNAASILRFSGSLLVNQLVAIIATLFITNLIAFFSKNGLLLLRGMLSIATYVLLMYITSWSRASSDLSKVKSGLLSENKAKGFVAGLIASIPFWVIAVLAFFAESGRFTCFEFLGVDGITAINRFINLPLGTLYVYANDMPALNLVFPLFTPAVAGIAYLFGTYGISLTQIFIYKPDKE